MAASPSLTELAAAARLGVPGGLVLEGADPVIATPYPVGAAAVFAAGGAACAASALAGIDQPVTVDVTHAAASLVSFMVMRFADRPVPTRASATNPTVAMYRTADDRWIHLHGGFPGLEAGTLSLLGVPRDADAIAAAVARWEAAALEDALAGAGLCGAVVRTPGEWAEHPQGRAVDALPAVRVTRIGDAPPVDPPGGPRPLSGIRVLDLTRVLAGPTCARTLAAHGAQVLKITSPRLPFHEAFVIDTGHGKRSAHLDLDDPADRDRLEELVATADVFSQGYRPGRLAARGFGPTDLARLRPGIVVVDISCYGPEGPWADRPGWEQLAQSASGLAVVQGGDGPPALIPAAACDYTTGYLAAWGAVEALRRRTTEGGSWLVEASLCQTAAWLGRLGPRCDPGAATGFGDLSGHMTTSETGWGTLTHLAPLPRMPRTPARWDQPTVPLGSHPARWW